MFRHISIRLLLLLTLIGASVHIQSQSLKISLDSAYLLMGRTTPLHVNLIIDGDPKGQLVIPKDSICDKVEILDILKADTSDMGNGRKEINRDIILQSFDSGVYRLNPILYVSGNETISSNRLVLKVFPVEVDSLQSIHDYADVSDVDRKFIDYLPDFIVDYGLWILAVVIILGAGAYVIYLINRKKNPFAAQPSKPIPPYDKDIDELNRLRAEKLCEQGKEKEFYTRLTDILRIYLHGRFGINAMEMTSTQIRHVLDNNEETRLSKENMNRVLETADFVKFAKVRPIPDDNVKAFNSAIQFVEDTKPQPEPEETAENGIKKENEITKQ